MAEGPLGISCGDCHLYPGNHQNVLVLEQRAKDACCWRKGGEKMARSVRIETNKNTVKIVVDGNEIHDVLEYQLEESAQGAFLTLHVAITESVEVQM